MNIENEEEQIELLKQKPQEPQIDPVMFVLGKMEEVITACMTLKARVDVIEEHLTFLLSKSSEYKKLLKKAEKVVHNEGKENRPIS
jgi:hypothetical protein